MRLARSLDVLFWANGQARGAHLARHCKFSPGAAHPGPDKAMSPTICTAITFTIVIDGKIIA